MELRLKHHKVVDLVLRRTDAAGTANGVRMSFDVGCPAGEEKNKTFFVVFRVSLSAKEYDASVSMQFEFEADCEVTDEFMKGDFPRINAPAISFPYVRAFLSNLTLQAGYTAVVLPSVNFVKLSERHKKE